MKQEERRDNNNERIARTIILSNTNRTQRDSLGWLGDIERAIIKALDAKDAAMPPPYLSATMTFAQFSEANRHRCESSDGFNHALGSWSTSDWFLAMIGELGEAANIAKKLNRVRDGIPGNKEKPDELRAKLRHELADAFVYLDLTAQSLGFNIADAAVEVFNAKSAEIGYPVKL